MLLSLVAGAALLVTPSGTGEYEAWRATIVTGPGEVKIANLHRSILLTPDNVPKMLAGLTDPDPNVRCAVAAALGDSRCLQASISSALILSLGDRNERVRTFCVASLARIGPSAVQPLLNVIGEPVTEISGAFAGTASQKHLTVQDLAAAALILSKAPVAQELILRIQPAATGTEIQYLCAVLKDRAEFVDTSPLLDSSNDLVKQAALSALSPSAVNALPKVDSLVRDTKLADAAIGAIERFGPTADPLKVQLIRSDPDSKVRESSAAAFARKASPMVVRALEDSITLDPDASVRLSALKGLIESVPAPSATDFLIQQFGNPEPTVEEAIVAFLKSPEVSLSPSASAVAVLGAGLTSRISGLPDWAAFSLSDQREFGDSALQAVIAAANRNPNLLRDENVIKVLASGSQRNPQAYALMVAGLENRLRDHTESESIHLPALIDSVLQEGITLPDLVAPIVNQLRAPFGTGFASVLPELGPPGVAALRIAAADRSYPISSRLTFISNLPTREQTSLYIPLLADANEEIRRSVALSLWRLRFRSEKVREIIKTWLESIHYDFEFPKIEDTDLYAFIGEIALDGKIGPKRIQADSMGALLAKGRHTTLAINRLHDLLDDPDDFVRSIAAKNLGNAPRGQAEPVAAYLLSYLDSHPELLTSRELRPAVFNSISKLLGQNTPTYRRVFKYACDDDSPERAASALASLAPFMQKDKDVREQCWKTIFSPEWIHFQATDQMRGFLEERLSFRDAYSALASEDFARRTVRDRVAWVADEFVKPPPPIPLGPRSSLPSFPWPNPPGPCQAAAFGQQLSWGLLGTANDSLGDVELRIVRRFQSIDPAFETSLFDVPGGFALMSKMERIFEDGRPQSEPYRFELGYIPPLNLWDYLGRLFMEEPGYSRLFVFVITTAAYQGTSSTKRLPSLSEGGLDLPPYLAAQKLAGHRGYLLVYTFVRPSGSCPKLVLLTSQSAPTQLAEVGFNR